MGAYNSKLALVFPGQGCQFVGMGADLYQAYAEAREIYDRADEVLGFPLSRLCFEGPAEELDDTANTQPAIYTASYASWRVITSRIGLGMPRVAYVAGHSLGEFTALAAAGAMSFEDCLLLVRRRAQAMRDSGALSPGGMAVILGLEDEEVASVIREASDGSKVWIANLNAPGQVVIAGEEAALERAMAIAVSYKAKRVLPLQVSVACHTPLMSVASQRLAEALEQCPIRRPMAPVVSNVTALPTSDPAQIRQNLLRQLTSPVRWVESVRAMVQDGVNTMLEIGPKPVLAGMVKRIDRDVNIYSATDLASIEALQPEAIGA